MAEYIEREAAYPLAKKICDAIDSEDFQRLNFGMRILDWIDDLPAADVRPVRRGKWTSVFDIGTVCNQCGYDIEEHGFDVRTDGGPNYCPNCGADMREES